MASFWRAAGGAAYYYLSRHKYGSRVAPEIVSRVIEVGTLWGGADALWETWNMISGKPTVEQLMIEKVKQHRMELVSCFSAFEYALKHAAAHNDTVEHAPLGDPSVGLYLLI